jgi:hypothetical protein
VRDVDLRKALSTASGIFTEVSKGTQGPDGGACLTKLTESLLSIVLK